MLLGGGAIAAEALEAAAAVALKAFCKWEDIPRGKKEDRRAGGTPAPGPPGDAGVELEVLGGPESVLNGPAEGAEGTSGNSPALEAAGAPLC